jgi:hypothetical protein
MWRPLSWRNRLQNHSEAFDRSPMSFCPLVCGHRGGCGARRAANRLTLPPRETGEIPIYNTRSVCLGASANCPKCDFCRGGFSEDVQDGASRQRRNRGGLVQVGCFRAQTPLGLCRPDARYLCDMARRACCCNSAIFRLINSSYAEMNRQNLRPVKPSKKPSRNTYMKRNRKSHLAGSLGYK